MAVWCLILLSFGQSFPGDFQQICTCHPAVFPHFQESSKLGHRGQPREFFLQRTRCALFDQKCPISLQLALRTYTSTSHLALLILYPTSGTIARLSEQYKALIGIIGAPIDNFDVPGSMFFIGYAFHHLFNDAIQIGAEYSCSSSRQEMLMLALVTCLSNVRPS